MMREQILELLRTDPSFREEVRRLVLTDELLALPSKFDQLVAVVHELAEIQRQQGEQIRSLMEAQKRTEEQVRVLAEAQRRTEEQLQRQAEQIQALTEAQRRTEEQLQRQAEQIQALAEAQRRTEEQLQRQAEQVRALTETQRRTEEQLQALTQQVSALVAAQSRMEEALQWLINWQRGEMGRREGERYERHVIRRAPVLFNGGEGGSPYEPMIQQRLASMLSREQREQLFHDEESDPFLADLIWWKDGQVAVVEISLQVDGYDVIRASRRAQTLRNASIQAIAVVIGRDWANPDAYDAAIRYRVEWLIGSEMSEGLRRFREA
jgi:DNA repair exonuclease SbcCD ATPase subunit